jgi:putative FmdB family regulatory protein
MPTYEYTCKGCGQSIEVFQKFSDKPLKVHDACGGDLQKVFHARGVVFKGGGFYATDSRGSSSASKIPDPNGSSESSKTGSKSKTESSETKADVSKKD